MTASEREKRFVTAFVIWFHLSWTVLPFVLIALFDGPGVGIWLAIFASTLLFGAFMGSR